MALSLHCAEILVNTIPDDRSWRYASKQCHSYFSSLTSILRSFAALVTKAGAILRTCFGVRTLDRLARMYDGADVLLYGCKVRDNLAVENWLARER
jgi:hypothetical protein